jgi:hypothetical protein
MRCMWYLQGIRDAWGRGARYTGYSRSQEILKGKVISEIYSMYIVQQGTGIFSGIIAQF